MLRNREFMVFIEIIILKLENYSDSDENHSAILKIDNDDKFCTSMKHVQ